MNHIKTHFGGVPKKYKCDQCEHSTAFARDLRKHKECMHGTRERKFACQHCDFKTTLESYLQKHIERSHQDKQLKCELCDYISNNPQSGEQSTVLFLLFTGKLPLKSRFSTF